MIQKLHLAYGQDKLDSGSRDEGQGIEMIKIVTQAKITQVVERLAGPMGGWASVTDVRKIMDIGHDFDILVTEMIIMGTLVVAPEDNQKTITEADRVAAINIGGQANHLIQLG